MPQSVFHWFENPLEATTAAVISHHRVGGFIALVLAC